MIIKKTEEIEGYLAYSKILQVLNVENNSIAYKFFGMKKKHFTNGKKHMKNKEKKVYSERYKILIFYLSKLIKRL